MLKVFVSYSSHDREHLETFRRHARKLEENGLVALWQDCEVLPGQPWAEEIYRELETARLVVVLLSPDFLASTWCLHELARALELRARKLLDIVPIVVRPCAWRTTELSTVQALPAGGAPITSWPDTEAAWREAVSAIGQLLRGGRHAPAVPSRADLILRYSQLLTADRRLMLLSPWRSGLEEMAQEIAQRSHGDNVTTLRVPTMPEMTQEDFYSELSAGHGGRTTGEFRQWLMQRSAPAAHSGAGHLVVLPYFGGPRERVRELGFLMRAVFEQTGTFSLLVFGQARCAELTREVQSSSLFTGIIVERIPGLDETQTRELLQRHGADPIHAERVLAVTGGHPEWTALAAPVVREGRFEELPQYLADLKLYGLAYDRLKHDEGQGERSHAGTALEKLLNGERVVRLTDVGADLSFPEVRLYYDGLVVERDGQTQFRCEAARLAAERALRVWRQ